MMPTGRPRFEVVVGASAAERRLVTVDTIRALTGTPSTGEGAVTDEALGLWLDAALSQCAVSCNMATFRASPPTLAQESVRATWDQAFWHGRFHGVWRHWGEPSQLLLPWRAPITSILITEGETELVENTDYRLLGAGVVERINGWWPTDGLLVADYVAGFVPLSNDGSYQEDGETLPADIIALIADQVRMRVDSQAIDLNLRSEDVPGVWSGTYNVPGGDAVDTSGLLRPLWDALAPYRAPPSFA